MENAINIINDADHLRFVETSPGEPGYIEYRYYEKDIAFMHTFVPPEKREHGIADALAVFALGFARKEKLKVLLFCPFMAKYVKEHSGYDDLVDNRFSEAAADRKDD